MPAGAVEGDHELRDEALAIRVLSHERLKLADGPLVATERELRVDAQLERMQANLLETVGLGATQATSRRPPSQIRARSRALPSRALRRARGLLRRSPMTRRLQP